MKLGNPQSTIGSRRPPALAGFTLIELLVVVAIIVILSSAVFVVGRGVLNSSHRQQTIVILKNLDAIMSEWQEKMGSLRVFGEQQFVFPAANYQAFALWNTQWTDATALPWNVSDYDESRNNDPNNPRLNAVRWLYVLSLQSNCRTMVMNLKMASDSPTPGRLDNNFQYVSANLPSNFSGQTATTNYLYAVDSFGRPIVLFQTRLPAAPVRGVYKEQDNTNVRRGHNNKLYVFVSAGPDGIFNTEDDIYSDSE